MTDRLIRFGVRSRASGTSDRDHRLARFGDAMTLATARKIACRIWVCERTNPLRLGALKSRRARSRAFRENGSRHVKARSLQPARLRTRACAGFKAGQPRSRYGQQAGRLTCRRQLRYLKLSDSSCTSGRACAKACFLLGWADCRSLRPCHLLSLSSPGLLS